MSTLLPFIVIGLTSGAVYGLAGVGLVLTYKTSNVFNFAHGALATIAAYVLYVLVVLHHWPRALAIGVAVLVVGPLLGLLMELLARRIQTASLTLQVGATVGLLLVIEAGVLLLYPASGGTRNVPVLLGTGTVEIFGTVVQVAQLVTFGFGVVVTALLSVFFRFFRQGIAMRAVVDNPELLDLEGTSPTATRRLAWMIGVSLATASGVLFAPLLPLDPVQLTLLVVSAFGAAAIGAFTSLPLTFAGGLVVGVLGALSTKWFTTGLLAGLPASLPFVVLFIVLLAFPKRYLVGRSFTVPRARPVWQAPASLQLTGGLAVVVFLAFVPSFAGVHLTDWTTFVAMTIVFLSLSFLVRTSGQVSLAHVAFTAIGATTFSHLTVGSGVPWLIALVLCGLVAIPIGALLAVPAIRLNGLYLALASFGFGVVLQVMFYSQGYMFGENAQPAALPRPHLGFVDIGSDRGFFYFALVLATVAALAVAALNRMRLGRLLRGASESPVALRTTGASVNVTHVLVFCLSAFAAAVGGALAGVAQESVSADAYQPLSSLVYFTVILIVVGGAPWDAVLASAGLFLIPSYVSGSDTTTVLQLAFGAVAIAQAVRRPGKSRALAAATGLVDRTFGAVRLPRWQVERPARPGVAPAEGDGAGLQVCGLEVRYGGVVAVDAVDLSAPRGRVTGLIGPNGAGKTTIFNACAGLVRPAAGNVAIGGVDTGRRGPAARARLGLGRTFQKMELLETMTVRENVEAGAEGVLAGARPLRHLASRPGERATTIAAAERALALCDLTELADRPAGSLSTGQRRLVELARCLAGPFEILLLDEPSSGLDHAETRRFGQILKRVLAERPVGILLVEHDMSLVLDLCEYIYVLDFGKLVFEGTPPEVMASPVVRAAYLGDAEVERAAGHADAIEERA